MVALKTVEIVELILIPCFIAGLVMFVLRLKSRITTDLSVFREFIPIIILLVYSFGGAELLRIIDKAGNVSPRIELGQSLSSCLATQDFWGALYFVNTIYTTIGWGNIYPCTIAGKLSTIVYTLVGIPLVIVVLEMIGTMFSLSIDRLWILAFQCYVKTKKQPKSSILPTLEPNLPTQKIPKTPLIFGLLLATTWILISCTYFSYTENWNFLDSFYFTMIATTTVGFGDFSPKRYELTIVIFAFLFNGLALISMAIQLVQNKIQEVFDEVQQQIIEEFVNRQLQGEDGNDMETTDVRDILKSKGAWITYLMSKGQMKALTEEYDKMSRMRVRGIQCSPEMITREVGACVMTDEKESSAITDMSDDVTQPSPDFLRRIGWLKEMSDKSIQAKAFGFLKQPQTPKSPSVKQFMGENLLKPPKNTYPIVELLPPRGAERFSLPHVILDDSSSFFGSSESVATEQPLQLLTPLRKRSAPQMPQSRNILPLQRGFPTDSSGVRRMWEMRRNQMFRADAIMNSSCGPPSTREDDDFPESTSSGSRDESGSIDVNSEVSAATVSTGTLRKPSNAKSGLLLERNESWPKKFKVIAQEDVIDDYEVTNKLVNTFSATEIPSVASAHGLSERSRYVHPLRRSSTGNRRTLKYKIKSSPSK